MRHLLFATIIALQTATTFAADFPIEISEAWASLINNTTVAAPMTGSIESVAVREGDFVSVGDALVQLDDSVVQTEFDAAKAAARAAKIQAENNVDARYATRTLEVREQELRLSEDANAQFKNSVPKTEIEKLRLVVDQSRLSIEQAEQQQRIAQAQSVEKEAAAQIVHARLQQHHIAAPVAGTVVEVNAKTGQWAEPGQPMVRIISTDPIRIECFVDAGVRDSNLIDRPVEFRLQKDHPNDPPRTGRVVFVSPEFNAVTNQTRLWAEVDNPDDQIQPGMRGRLVVKE